jgi:hypothetical protein
MVSQEMLFLFYRILLLALILNDACINQKLPGRLFGLPRFSRSLSDDFDLLLNGNLCHDYNI